MKTVMISGLCLLTFLAGCNQIRHNRTLGKTISVAFILDDSVVELKDDFVFTVIYNGARLVIATHQNLGRIPRLENGRIGGVEFAYKKYQLFFKDLSKEILNADQNIEFRFGVDRRPFNNKLGLISIEKYKSDTLLKELDFLELNLLEYGDGRQFVNKIH